MMAANLPSPVRRAVGLLQAVAVANGPVSIKELGAQLALPQSTVHRLLRLLIEEDMVTRDAKSHRYLPGPALYRLSASLSGGRVPEVAYPIMRGVVAACNETCLLAQYDAERLDMRFVARVESTHQLRFTIPLHESLPLIWGCSGRVIAAHLTPSGRERLISVSRPAPVTGEPVPSLKSIEESVTTIRAVGFDHTRGQKIADSVGFAGPVFGSHGQLFGSLSITIPRSRYDGASHDALGRLISDAAREISGLLRGETPPRVPSSSAGPEPKPAER